jgi:GNAT superfamily N-acetyltransferase
MYTLRFFTKGDWNLWRDLHHEAYRPRVEALWGWDDAVQESFTLKEFELAYDGRFVIVVDGRDAGYLSYNWESEELYLANFIVAADLRGKGLGERILRDIQAMAAMRGLGVRLRTFINNPARRLYERCGFQLIGEDNTKHFVMRWRS